MQTKVRRGLQQPKRRAPPGAPPGTVIPDPKAPRPVITVIGYGPDDVFERRIGQISDLKAIVGHASVTWVNVVGLGDVQILRQLSEVFALHDLALEDVVNLHQRAKVENYDDHLFIVSRNPTSDADFDIEQTTLFLGANYVLTFQERASDCFEPIITRLRKNHSRLRHSRADYLAYSLLDAITDAYFPILERVGEEIEELEQAVLRRPDAAQVGRLHEVKRDLLALRRSIWPQREMFNVLIRDESPFVSEQTRVFLRDCYDHSIQLLEIVETYREIATGLLDLYLSSVSTHMNEIMKVLTIIATIFIPLGFIAGLYGMNFDRTASAWNMPELGWPWGYPLALGMMAAVAGGLILYFRKKGWIGARRDLNGMRARSRSHSR